jgi:hypothetical protein
MKEIGGIEDTIGTKLRKKIELFYNELIEAYELEPEFKSAAMMLVVPDPLGEKPGVSVIGLEKEGRIYNTRQMLNQLNRAGVDSERSSYITSTCWKQLNQIDPGFSSDGTIHTQSGKFGLIANIFDKLDQIKEEIGRAAVTVRNELEKSVE